MTEGIGFLGGGRRNPLRRAAWCRSLAARLPLMLVLGCSTGRALNPFDRSQGLETIRLRVDNLNLHDALLVLQRDKERIELGTVQGQGGFRYFEFSWPEGRPVDLEIQLVVGDRFRLPPFPAGVTGQLQVVIAADLHRSVIRRR